MAPVSPNPEVTSALSELARLRDAGRLSEPEFAAMRGILIARRSEPGSPGLLAADVRVDQTGDDCGKIVDALAGMAGFDAATEFAQRFEIFEVPAGSRVSPRGLAIVLRGRASLELDGAPLAELPVMAHFHEERLLGDVARDATVLAARDDVRLAVLDREVWASSSVAYRHSLGTALLGDLLTTRMHEFQQPINCCNITAVALSLTALGFPTDINAVFKRCRLPAAYVVDDGLTLSELHDVACTYVYTQGLSDKVAVECYHFDDGVTQEQDLTNALNESRRVAGDDDVLVANFGVTIAHANSKLRAGGHFALLGKHNPRS